MILDIPSIVPWRMNLVAVDQEKLYIASHNTIRVYENNTCTKILETDQDTPINAIKFAHNILACVDDSGFLTLFLDSRITLDNTDSTWGLAISPDWIAVSSNEHCITLWSTTTYTKTVLGSHDHNIPNICFNSSGTLLASASIDQTCKVWDIDKKECLFMIEGNEWGWGCIFIPPKAFQAVMDQVDVCSTYSDETCLSFVSNDTDYHPPDLPEDKTISIQSFSKSEMILFLCESQMILMDEEHQVHQELNRQLSGAPYNGLQRLCFVEKIPSLSMLVIASQSGQVGIYSCIYPNQLHLLETLYYNSPILGLGVQTFSDPFPHATLVIVLYNKETHRRSLP